MTVGKICVREVDVIGVDETVRCAARRMLDRKVGSLIVTNVHKNPIGIVTDRDLALRVIAPALNPDETAVREVMTLLPRSIWQDTSIEDALSAMRAGPYRRLPVVDDANQLVGVLSVDDVLDLLAEEFGTIRQLLHDESPASLADA